MPIINFVFKVSPWFDGNMYNVWKLQVFSFYFQKQELQAIPSLDYSNDEDVGEATRLMYEKYSNKMDESKFCSFVFYYHLTVKAYIFWW